MRNQLYLFSNYALFDISLLFDNMLLTHESTLLSVVRAFAHGAMGHWINPSWSTHSVISRSSQCSTTGVTKAVVCAILSV